MKRSKYLTRQEIAAIIEMTTVHVGRRESQLGLVPFKIVLGRRFIRYRRAGAELALRERGFEVPIL